MNRERQAEFKERLREALQAANMRPIELSEKTGIPKSMVSYYLSGKFKPKADRIYAICQALDISEAWLLGYDVPKNRTQDQKKNDHLAQVIVKLRTDSEFYDLVSMLAELPAEQRASLVPLVSALRAQK